tara:strand:+ start:5887 stop:6174 length:288 start_codon:yes stop_codon:yes gene_type:complete
MRRVRLQEGTYMQDLRKQRNMLLARCDWTQAADSPLSTADKAAWATYRQALRDFPDNVGSYNELDDYIYFPDPPGYAGDGPMPDTSVPTPTPAPL